MNYLKNGEKLQKEASAAELQQLKEVMEKAIIKIKGTKENDLCKYLPISSGGYVHHFTMRKMKTEQPVSLKSMIEKYILNVAKPSTVTPKSRAPRGSRKRKDQVNFTKSEVERMLALARRSGMKDELLSEIISKLTPKKSLASCKRELISSVKAGKVIPELWNSYVESVNLYNDYQENGGEYAVNTLEAANSITSQLSGKAFPFPSNS